MKSVLAAGLTVFCFVLPVQADEMEAPFKNSKVGDWATFKFTSKTNNITTNGTQKWTITGKTDKDVTIKSTITTIVNGREQTEAGTEVPTEIALLLAKLKTDFDGKAKVKATGKEFDCVRYKDTLKGTVTGEMIWWYSKTGPLLGLVKMQGITKFGDATTELTMELTGSGSK